MAASLAFAGLSGCKSNEQSNIVPYVKQPDGMILGKPLFFATAMPFGADAIGVRTTRPARVRPMRLRKLRF